MRAGKKPTHLLKVKQRDGDGKTTVGVGWLNEDGSMSLALNPCVVLSWTDNVMINAFPVELEKDEEPPPRATPTSRAQPAAKRQLTPFRENPRVVVPQRFQKGHDFREVDVDTGVSFQRCAKCALAVAVNDPFDGIVVDNPCPEASHGQ